MVVVLHSWWKKAYEYFHSDSTTIFCLSLFIITLNKGLCLTGGVPICLILTHLLHATHRKVEHLQNIESFSVMITTWELLLKSFMTDWFNKYDGSEMTWAWVPSMSLAHDLLSYEILFRLKNSFTFLLFYLWLLLVSVHGQHPPVSSSLRAHERTSPSHGWGGLDP